MERFDLINYLIDKKKLKNYLEIGVRNPDDCFNRINCEIKHSVDPCIEIDSEVDYKFTSDSFFSLLVNGSIDLPPDYKWDIIFIDGLHISSQVERDVINSLEHLSDNGFILLHDCNPPSIYHARENYDGGEWTGTVWKAFYKFRSSRDDLKMFTVDTDWGVGVIQKGVQECCSFDNPYYEYLYFESRKKEHLNLISVEEFLEVDI